MSTKDLKHAFITVSYKKIKGNLRALYHVRICPVETKNFPFGLSVRRPTLSKDRAEEYAAAVDEYIENWLSFEKEHDK